MADAARQSSPELPVLQSAGEFEAWLLAGNVGDQVVYAIAREFPRNVATAILASGWLRRGLITTVFRRQGDGTTHFIAEKKADPCSLENGLRRVVRGVVARAADKDEDSPAGRIARLIARHANFQKAAPTYREMATAAGLGSSQAALSAARRACGELIASGAVMRDTTKDRSRTRFVLPDGRKTGWLDLRKGRTDGCC